MFFYTFLVLLATGIDGAQKGEPCSAAGLSGVCQPADTCLTAITDTNRGASDEACTSNSPETIVCCNDRANIGDDQCRPIPEYKTGKKTGQKAWDKCLEYQQLVYPCVEGAREDRCPHSAVEHLIPGGNTHTGRHEFPYLVLLGYTNDKKQLDWLCAGALVSDKFVLTAAHCVYSRLVGPVTHVALNPPDRADIEPETILRIKSVIKHPDYRPPMTYHDIALIELEDQAPLSSRVVPLCLVGADPDEETVVATTWNTLDILHTGITWLRKISVTKYSSAECGSLYPGHRRGGYNESTQACYGDRSRDKHVCQDDGGAALVVRTRVPSCMLAAVGVASYGKGCLAHSPGVYVRVLPYLNWIEGVVWP